MSLNKYVPGHRSVLFLSKTFGSLDLCKRKMEKGSALLEVKDREILFEY